MSILPPAPLENALSPIEPLIPESDGELGEEITRLAAHINAAQYRFLRLLAVLIERGAWGGYGIKSPAHWLNYRCGIGLNAAREKVRVAKALATLPGICEAFGRGEISYSKVKAMTRAATSANEACLLNIARYGTAQHVEMLIRKYRRVRRLEDARLAAAQDEQREFLWRYDDDGSLVFHGRLPPAEGAAFLKAMEVVMRRMEDALPRKRKPEPEPEPEAEAEMSGEEESVPEPPEPTFAQKRADALMLMAEQTLSTVDGGLKPLANADKFQVALHMRRPARNVTAATFREGGELQPARTEPCASGMDSGSCTLEHNAHHFPLPEATARRLCCDAAMVPVLEDGKGNPLDIGRRTRLISPALRRALHMRDGICRFPGCCESRWVDAHHVVHWCEGGFRFFQPGGEAMARALFPQFADSGADPLAEELAIEAEHSRRGLDIGPRTGLTRWSGEILDYDWAVYMLRDLRARECADVHH